MKYSKNKWPLALCLVCTMARSADMLLFDDPAVAVMQHDGKLQGHYIGRSLEAYMAANIKSPIACEFLFIQTSQDENQLRVSAFENAIEIPDDPYLTEGLIQIDRGTWRMVFKNVPRGCASKGDGDRLVIQPAPCCDSAEFFKKGGIHIKPLQRIPAVGFRILDKSRAIIKPDPSSNPQAQKHIKRGEVVAVLKIAKGTAHVRYVVPSTGEVIYGRMSSNALVDPFKPAATLNK